jgi:thiol:disulfide interchange protein DsbC
MLIWAESFGGCLSALVICMASLPAMAGEAEVRQAVQTLRPGATIESIAVAPIKGLYEVFVDGEIVYVDEAGTTLLVGTLLDVAGQRNLTQERRDKLLRVNFAQLPLALAVKTVKGNGARVFASFEDPSCGYCKRLHQELHALDNFTLYTFLVPLLGPESHRKIQAIWCAPDRAQALRATMTGTSSLPLAQCEVPMDKLVALAARTRVQGTPTLVFEDGSRSPGLLPMAVLDRQLSERSGGASQAGVLAKDTTTPGPRRQPQ